MSIIFVWIFGWVVISTMIICLEEKDFKGRIISTTKSIVLWPVSLGIYLSYILLYLKRIEEKL